MIQCRAVDQKLQSYLVEDFESSTRQMWQSAYRDITRLFKDKVRHHGIMMVTSNQSIGIRIHEAIHNTWNEWNQEGVRLQQNNDGIVPLSRYSTQRQS